VNASTPSENRSSNANPNELWKGELDLELTQFVALTVQLESVVKKLEALGKADPRIQRIRTIPGLGPRTAEIRVACIDDPHSTIRIDSITVVKSQPISDSYHVSINPAKPTAMEGSPSVATRR